MSVAVVDRGPDLLGWWVERADRKAALRAARRRSAAVQGLRFAFYGRRLAPAGQPLAGRERVHRRRLRKMTMITRWSFHVQDSESAGHRSVAIDRQGTRIPLPPYYPPCISDHQYGEESVKRTAIAAVAVMAAMFVVEPSPAVADPMPLKTLAAAARDGDGIKVGSAIRSTLIDPDSDGDETYEQRAAAEFSLIASENDLIWEVTEPTEPTRVGGEWVHNYAWDRAEEVVDFAGERRAGSRPRTWCIRVGSLTCP